MPANSVPSSSFCFFRLCQPPSLCQRRWWRRWWRRHTIVDNICTGGGSGGGIVAAATFTLTLVSLPTRFNAFGHCKTDIAEQAVRTGKLEKNDIFMMMVIGRTEDLFIMIIGIQSNPVRSRWTDVPTETQQNNVMTIANSTHECVASTQEWTERKHAISKQVYVLSSQLQAQHTSPALADDQPLHSHLHKTAYLRVHVFSINLVPI